MARPLRVAVPGAWYHVVARGIERRAIFRSEVYYRKFELLLASLVERFGAKVHTYALMPNHYHLQIATPRLNLSEAIRWLNISYASWFNRKTRRKGPLLEGRFKAAVHEPSEASWTGGPIMNLKFFLSMSMAGAALFVGGCAGLSGPNGLGQRVLVVCKTTADQQAAAQRLSNQYFSQVASGKKARPARRYVAVQTLDPNEKQRGKYLQTRAAAEKKAEANGEPLGAGWADASSLHCVMVFDVVTHESVGTNCYVVGTLPSVGELNTYDTFPAEFVASSAEYVPQ